MKHDDRFRDAEDARAQAVAAARSAHYSAILARTARALADSMTRERVYESISALLQTELRADSIAIYDVNPQIEAIHLEFQSRDATGQDVTGAGADISASYASELRQAVTTATPRFIEQVAAAATEPAVTPPGASQDNAGPPPAAQRVQSVALAPLVLDGQSRLLLSIGFHTPRVFDAADRQLIQDIAIQVAIAFRNASYMTALERRADRLAALARAQQQLAHVTNADNLPESIADAVRSVFPFAVSDVYAANAHELVRVLMLRDGIRVDFEPATDSEMALARETLRTGVSRLAVHLFDDRGTKRGTTELCAVVRYGTRSTGVLRLLAETHEDFDLQDLDLLSILMRQAGAAVERSRAFTIKDFQRQRAEGAAELARVSLRASSVAGGAGELLEVLDRFVPSIGKAIGVARSRDGQFEYIATSGTLDILQGHKPDGALGLAALTPSGSAIELVSLQQAAAPDIQPPLPDEWAFAVPLSARDRLLGALIVSAPRRAPLLQRDRVTLERLSTSLALALEALILDEDERKAREREQMLATALTTIDHPIFILDRVGVRFANPAAVREYGWTQAELVETPFEHLVVGIEPRPEPRIGDENGDVNGDPGLSLVHHVHRRRDGSEFPAAVTLSPLFTHNGETLGQVVSVRNVTADRSFEQQLRQTEKMIALGELVAGVAHEINNPLTGISAFAQLLLEESLTEDQRESVRLIKQESDRATAVIRDLLVFARKTDPKSIAVDINELLMRSLRLRAYPLRNAGVSVAFEADPTAPVITGDGQALQQVMLNLIGNAEYAMRDSAVRQLTVRTDTVPGFIRIAISDTGTGMAPEVQHRMFEPFFTTKDDGVGTGLGLSVSYGIVQAHGGHIEVVSEVNVGTTLSVLLPANSQPHPLADPHTESVIADSTPVQPSRS